MDRIIPPSQITAVENLTMADGTVTFAAKLEFSCLLSALGDSPSQSTLVLDSLVMKLCYDSGVSTSASPAVAPTAESRPASTPVTRSGGGCRCRWTYTTPRGR